MGLKTGLKMRTLFAGLLTGFFFLPGLALAYTFSVSPIRVFFEPNQKTMLVTIGNDDDVPLKLQIKLVSWTQSADGKDIYADSDDLIYYPRSMTLAAKESRVVRLGIKTPMQERERTYRLQIEDVPGEIAPTKGPAINFRYRFSIPIFLPPLIPNRVAEIEELTVKGGKVRIPVANRGNQHVRFDRITAKTAPGFSKDAEVWYVLPGATRSFQVELPREECIRAGTTEIAAVSEASSLKRSIVIRAEDCQ